MCFCRTIVSVGVFLVNIKVFEVKEGDYYEFQERHLKNDSIFEIVSEHIVPVELWQIAEGFNGKDSKVVKNSFEFFHLWIYNSFR